MRRATLGDIEFVNSCIGKEFPGVDFSDVLKEPLHVCLLEDGSGAIFMFRGPGIYEVHVFFEVRGKAAIELGHRMLDQMRVLHDAHLFWAMVPVGDRKTRIFTRLMGWKSKGLKETMHGPNELFVSEDLPCLPQ